MIDELARLEDALKRQYVNNARQDVREVLVVASAPPADLVRRLLDLFPNSRITVIAHEEQDLADLRGATLSHERVRLVRGGVAAGHHLRTCCLGSCAGRRRRRAAQ